jgi:hypothetical protein
MSQPTPATYNAFTAPINPPGATPVLNIDQIWAALELKVPHAEWFVGGALKSTDVISVDTNKHGQRVTTREVVFVEGDKRVREVCTEYPGLKIDFEQPGGGLVTNVVSSGENGPEDLYLTYTYVCSDITKKRILIIP